MDERGLGGGCVREPLEEQDERDAAADARDDEQGLRHWRRLRGRAARPRVAAGRASNGSASTSRSPPATAFFAVVYTVASSKCATPFAFTYTATPLTQAVTKASATPWTRRDTSQAEWVIEHRHRASSCLGSSLPPQRERLARQRPRPAPRPESPRWTRSSEPGSRLWHEPERDHGAVGELADGRPPSSQTSTRVEMAPRHISARPPPSTSSTRSTRAPHLARARRSRIIVHHGVDCGALRDRSTGGVLEVLAEVLGREVRQGAEPQRDAGHATRPLRARDRGDA